MATNKETVTMTFISIELPIVITTVLVFGFPPIVIPGHSFISPFN
ncbi:hypothetical protein [Bacillus thuringiensis]|nr:hypothetical protein [Bacillus thuringiensis]